MVREKRAITADTALRVAWLFDTTPDSWINLQVAHHLSEAPISARDELAAIKPLAAA